MNILTIIRLGLITLLLSACQFLQPEPVVFKPTASLQEIMSAIIDPNIDYVWNSVSTVSTSQGTEEKQPQTDADWLAIRQHALTVLEASNLLLIEGRPVATTGVNTSTGGAELAAPAIEQLIASQHADYIARAHGLHAALQQVLVAVDKKDVEALENAGGLVEQACEQCHSQFWYPNDQRPK